MKKYLSWSELSCWEHDRKEHYNRYVLGKENPPNKEMILGSIIHETIANPFNDWEKKMREEGFRTAKMLSVRKILDKLAEKEIMKDISAEVFMTCKFDDIELLSIFDGFDPERRILVEHKSTNSADRWNNWTADFNRQISFYALVYHQNTHNFFREIRLNALNTSKGTVHTYLTARSRKDIMDISKQIRRAVTEMKYVGVWDKRKSNKEFNQPKLWEEKPQEIGS